MTTLDATERELLALVEVERIIARARQRVGFAAGSSEAAAFMAVERVIDVGRPRLIAQRVAMAAQQRVDHLLGLTSFGQRILRDRKHTDKEVAEALDPRRRRDLLSASPLGRRVLEDEEREEREERAKRRKKER